jgi:ADP-heptose:LPS heptosyltransferase
LPTPTPHDYVWRRIDHDSPALALAEYFIELRRRIAPPGSRRERFSRGIYVPIVRLLRSRARLKIDGGVPVVHVERWRGLKERTRELPAPLRVLILKLDHIGDFVVALPALQQLRIAWPNARITVACGSWNCSWAQQSGLFNEVVRFDFFTVTNAAWRGATAEQFRAFEDLNLGPFDLAIDLRHDPDTRPLLEAVDARFRVGFSAPADQGGKNLDIALPNMEHISVGADSGRPVHADLRLRLLAHAAIEMFNRDVPIASCLLSPIPQLPLSRPYIVLAPGAGSPIRVWPISRLAEIGRILANRHDLDIIVVGSTAERETGEIIARSIPSDRVKNLAGSLPLIQLPSLIAGARLYVGNDTGTTHLAAGLDVPTVAIISGVPELEVWYPSGRKVIVIAGRIACSPCYLKEAAQCPFEVACIMEITLEDVLNACEDLLNSE